jgi:stage II sporulation protein D
LLRLWGALFAGIFAAVISASIVSQADGATDIKVCGSGNGHGVGLSQYGAYGRAKAGQGYARIVKSYYRGVALKKADNPPVGVLLGSKSLSDSHRVVVRPESKARLVNLKTKGSVALGPGAYAVRYLKDRNLYRVVDLSRKKAVGAYRGPLIFRRVSGSPLKYGKKLYRGVFMVRASKSRVLLVNRLRMEAYLRGVVPREMPSSWHPEALKSQAVAARSYARAARRSGAFNFYADTRDQVYGGRSAETAATNRAVRATARIHAVYDGKPITAFFHSSGGGYTESSAYVFSASPYLKAVRDVDGSGRPFERRVNSPWTSWKGTLDSDGSRKLGIGNLQRVRVLSRSRSGRALKIEVTGTNGKKTISGQYDIRYALKTNGLTRADGSRYPSGILPSARVKFGSACG